MQIKRRVISDITDEDVVDYDVNIAVYWDYIHKVHVILHDNLQRESHKPHVPPTSDTWLLLLRKQTNTGDSTAVTAEIHCDISLGSLTVHAPEAGDFVELLLL